MLLLLLFLLCIQAFPVYPFMQRATGSRPSVEPAFAKAISSRQVSTRKLLYRRTAVEITRRATANCGTLSPSPGVYPTCAGGTGTGFANYPGWTMYLDDLGYYGKEYQPGDFYWTKTLAECIGICAGFPANSAHACAGAVMVKENGENQPCYLHDRDICSGFFQTDENDSLSLIGGCAAWAGIVSPEMDAVCCNY